MRLRTALLAVVCLVLTGLTLPAASSYAGGASTSRLSGTVLGSDGRPVHATVTPLRWNPPQPPMTTGSWGTVLNENMDAVEADTDAAGRYAFAVPAGTYRLRVASQDGTLAQEFYPDGTTVESGVDVTVTSGATVTGLDVRLDPAGSISGTVTGPDGAGLGIVYVHAYRVGDTAGPVHVLYSFTSSDGRFRVAGLPAGSYVLRFNDLQHRFADEYWPNAASAAAATPVQVVGGLDRSGVDESMTAPSGASPGVDTDTGTVRNLTRPRVIGKPKVGRVLRVSKGVWAPTTVSVSYRWLANGRPVAKATRARLKLTRAFVGKRMAVRVVGSRMAWLSATVTTRATVRVRR